MKNTSVIAGLDFGTTNSAFAICEDGSVRVVNINNTGSGERTLRSVVYVDNRREMSIGQKAIDMYTGTGGRSCRFLQSLKTFLADKDFTGTAIFGRRYSIEELISCILKEIKRVGDEHAGRSINEVILGRPVKFSDDPNKDKLAEERLLSAALKAGFKTVGFEFEPIAATLAYLERMKEGQEETVLMGDFGGGTSDFTVMRLHPKMRLTADEKRERILSVGGVYVGGDTFDSRIMYDKLTPYFGRDLVTRDMSGKPLRMPAWIMYSLCERHTIPFLRDNKTLEIIREIQRTTDTPGLVENLYHVIHENRGFSIFQAIEKAKTQLSSASTAVICYQDSHLNIETRITREEFESCIADDLQRITRCVQSTLERAAVGHDGIDRVLLTGGSSFVPAVRRIFSAMFGEDKLVNLDAFTSVAHGLAVSARLRSESV